MASFMVSAELKGIIKSKYISRSKGTMVHWVLSEPYLWALSEYFYMWTFGDGGFVGEVRQLTPSKAICRHIKNTFQMSI